MSKVEEVARALAEADGLIAADVIDPALWERRARAAIAAMRTPSEAMLKAMTDAEEKSGCSYAAFEHMYVEDAWPIMIDAALQE